MIKDQVITVEYRPHSRFKHRFKYTVWRKGKPVKSRCSRDIDSDFVVCAFKKSERYPLRLRMSTVIGHLLRYRKHHKEWMELDGERVYNTIYYNILNFAIKTIADYLERWGRVYKFKLSEHDGKEDEEYGTDLFDVFRIYAFFQRWHDEIPKAVDEMSHESDFKRNAYWMIMKQLMRVREWDFVKCYRLLVDEMDNPDR